MLESVLTEIVGNKIAAEIGPSTTGKIIYKNANSIDDIIFSKSTVWSSHNNNEYNYFNGKKGKVIINDAINI